MALAAVLNAVDLRGDALAPADRQNFLRSVRGGEEGAAGAPAAPPRALVRALAHLQIQLSDFEATFAHTGAGRRWCWRRC